MWIFNDSLDSTEEFIHYCWYSIVSVLWYWITAAKSELVGNQLFTEVDSMCVFSGWHLGTISLNPHTTTDFTAYEDTNLTK